MRQARGPAPANGTNLTSRFSGFIERLFLFVGWFLEDGYLLYLHSSLTIWDAMRDTFEENCCSTGELVLAQTPWGDCGLVHKPLITINMLAFCFPIGAKGTPTLKHTVSLLSSLPTNKLDPVALH